jgi:sugar lactone lactonase YvrE
MTPLLHPKAGGPRLVSLDPPAAMPNGEVELRGTGLQTPNAGILPTVQVGDTPVFLSLSRPNRTVIRIPEGAISGDVVLSLADPAHPSVASNSLDLRVAVPMAESLHPVANPAVDADGNVYATVSGARGQSVPVSIYSIARDFQVRPFVRDLLNATGLAFDPSGYLYASSRAEGTVYRISPEGAITTYAEGMGIATGIAFDRDGNLYVGDRSGTIFKVGPDKLPPDASPADREIFVYATLEPSISAYHLAFNDEGTLFVSGPTTSSNQSIYAIDRDGRTTVFYQGLGRAQGLAFDVSGNLYVAASLRGQRGIVRITPQREASLTVSGNDLVGLAFLEDGCAALATKNALYHVALDIEGRRLI